MSKLLIALASLALAGTALAQADEPESQDRPDNAQTQQQREPEAKERLICRRLSPAATGSQLGQRRCLTAAQWRAINRAR